MTTIIEYIQKKHIPVAGENPILNMDLLTDLLWIAHKYSKERYKWGSGDLLSTNIDTFDTDDEKNKVASYGFWRSKMDDVRPDFKDQMKKIAEISGLIYKEEGDYSFDSIQVNDSKNKHMIRINLNYSVCGVFIWVNKKFYRMCNKK